MHWVIEIGLKISSDLIALQFEASDRFAATWGHRDELNLRAYELDGPADFETATVDVLATLVP